MEYKFGISVVMEGGAQLQFGATRLPGEHEEMSKWFNEEVNEAIEQEAETGVLYLRHSRVDAVLYQKLPPEVNQQPASQPRRLYVPE